MKKHNNKFTGKKDGGYGKFKKSSGYDNSRKSSGGPKKELKYVAIENMTLGPDSVIIGGIVERIVQTGGPTIFDVSDGTGTMPLKGFVSPGARAFPEIKENDAVRAIVKVVEFNGEIEGEIVSIKRLTDEDKNTLIKTISDIQRKRAKVEEIDFLIKSDILDNLKERFVKAAGEIRLAIIQNRPIIIRHHNDTDGYSAGFALERAILPLIEKQHNSLKASWEYYMRSPSTAPFYELSDSIRDTASSLRNVAKFSNKMPLIIILDNGSSSQDLMAIKQGKIHGMEFIVVDHHYFDEDVISDEVLVHINPFLVGEDGARFSAGMLCAELARLVNNSVANINQIPALAGLADRIDLNNKSAVDDYVKIAEKEGYSRDLLSNISTVIDYVSSRIRFMEVREYIEVVFGEPRNKQKELVDLLAPYIKKLDAKALEMGRANAVVKKVGKTNLQLVDIDETFPGFDFYPKPGRSIGIIHDDVQKTKKLTSVISIGLMRTAMTIRATDEANFSVHKLIEFIEKKLPNAFVDGGGHKNAGSINFVPNKQKEVLKLVEEFIKNG
ncbi:MAG: hypothetical protein KKF56_02220 [Nanoarchaeota archaeon]|nr:hypothetical protein [Nanoarchaeota archaeon]